MFGDGGRPGVAGVGQNDAVGDAMGERPVIARRQQLDPAQRTAAAADLVGEVSGVESGIAHDQRVGAVERREKLGRIVDPSHLAVRGERGGDLVGGEAGEQNRPHDAFAAPVFLARRPAKRATSTMKRSWLQVAIFSCSSWASSSKLICLPSAAVMRVMMV